MSQNTTSNVNVVAGVPAAAATSALYTQGTPGLVVGAPGAVALPPASAYSTAGGMTTGGMTTGGLTTSAAMPGTAGYVATAVPVAGVIPVTGVTAMPVGAAAYPATGAYATGTTGSSAHMTKEMEKEQKRALKEQEKEEAHAEKEQRKLEKEQIKAEKKAEKEQIKAEKQHEKEEKKAIKEHEKEEAHLMKERRKELDRAQKERRRLYKEEEALTTQRLQQDVMQWDQQMGPTAPAQQVQDLLPPTADNVGLFVAVARGMNLVTAGEMADPYVSVKLISYSREGKEKVQITHKSETLRNTMNPQWFYHTDETPHMTEDEVHWMGTARLRIEVWDKDSGSHDDLLGWIDWPLSELDGKVTRGNFPLRATDLPNTHGRRSKLAVGTQPGVIWVEIRYRSPFGFFGMDHPYPMGQPTAASLLTTQPPAGSVGAVGLTGGQRAAVDATYDRGMAGSTTGPQVVSVTGGTPLLVTGAPLVGATTMGTGSQISTSAFGTGVHATGVPLAAGVPYGTGVQQTAVAVGEPGAPILGATGAPLVAGMPGYGTTGVGARAPGAYIDNDPAHYQHHPHSTGAIPGHHHHHGAHGAGAYDPGLKSLGDGSHAVPGYTSAVAAPGVMMPTSGLQGTGAPIMSGAGLAQPVNAYAVGAGVPLTTTTMAGGSLAALPPATAGLSGVSSNNVAVHVTTDAPAGVAPSVAAAALRGAEHAAETVGTTSTTGTGYTR